METYQCCVSHQQSCLRNWSSSTPPLTCHVTYHVTFFAVRAQCINNTSLPRTGPLSPNSASNSDFCPFFFFCLLFVSKYSKYKGKYRVNNACPPPSVVPSPFCTPPSPLGAEMPPPKGVRP